MEKTKLARQRTRAIAHLYTAVAKVDGITSLQERLQAPYYARISQRLLDVNEMGTAIKQMIEEEFRFVQSDSAFSDWTPEQHVDEALRILRNQISIGDWGAALAGLQNEEGLESVAAIDGYTIGESRMLSYIQERLRKLRTGEAD